MEFQSEKQAAGWLAGLIDGDGCIFYYETPLPSSVSTVKRRGITVSVTDPEIIDAFESACATLGIPVGARSGRAGKGTHKDVHTNSIAGGAGFRRFAETVPLQCARKRETLDKILNSYTLDGTCAGCGVPWSDNTEGCNPCYHRRYSTARAGGRKRGYVT